MTRLLLLVPLACGALITHRLMGEKNRLQIVAAGGMLGFLTLAMAVNTLLRSGQPLHRSVWLATAGMAVFAVLLYFRKSERSRYPEFRRATWLFLAGGLALTYFYAVVYQNTLPDDDYFIHAPLQGQFREGLYPLVNPFFPDIVYGGHYARNLLVATLNVFDGGELVVTQMWATVAVQLLSFAVLFLALYQATDSEVQAILGTVFVFLGGNAGARGGWLDSIDNNNPLAQALVALTFYLLMRLWKEPGWATSVITALVLGGFAWVYETHFGLMVLTGGATLLLLKALRAEVATAALTLTLAAFLLSGPLGVTQGGTLGNLYHRIVSRGQDLGETRVSAALQRQNQEVSLHFPKEKMFQILFSWGPKASISRPYFVLPGLREIDFELGEPGYAYIWSWRALRVHWLALLLAPLSLVLLIRARHTAGLFFWNLGAIAYLVPAVVDFGIWENEQYRWNFVAAWAFAGALGLALGSVFERYRETHPGPLWQTEFVGGRFRLQVGGAGLFALGLLCLTWLNSVGSLDHLRRRVDSVHSLRQALLPLDFEAWMEGQANFNFLPADYRTAVWLRENVKPGERILTNNREEGLRNIYYDSTMMAVSGMPESGRALPEIHGEWPYRLNPPARAFWATLDPGLLDDIGADWLVLREFEADLSEELASLHGVDLKHTEVDTAGAHRWVFQVTRPAREPYEKEETPAELEVAKLEIPAALESQSYYPLSVELRALRPIQGEAKLYYDLTRSGDQELVTDPIERVHTAVGFDLAAAETTTLPIHFVTPLEEGRYELRLYRVFKGVSRPLAGPALSFEVDYRRRLEGLTMNRLEPSSTLEPGVLGRFQVELHNPTDSLVRSRRPLRVAVLLRPDGATDYPIMAESALTEINLDLSPGETQTLSLPSVVPSRPGSYRCHLLLAPTDGLLVFRGSSVELKPATP